ncbi:hypothetical protein AHAS_Ahas04G0075000 [Arachis hypogaea]
MAAPLALALSLPEAPSHPLPPISTSHPFPNLSFSFDVDEFRHPLDAVFRRFSLKLVSVVATSTSSSRRHWFR